MNESSHPGPGCQCERCRMERAPTIEPPDCATCGGPMFPSSLLKHPDPNSEWTCIADHKHVIPTSLATHCAACHRKLGSLTAEGWTWTAMPARLVHRRRLIEEHPADGSVDAESLPSAPYDDFRMRTVESVRGAPWVTPLFRLWEYPYTCDADVCMNALGAEWKTDRDKGPPFVRMPAGRILS